MKHHIAFDAHKYDWGDAAPCVWHKTLFLYTKLYLTNLSGNSFKTDALASGILKLHFQQLPRPIHNCFVAPKLYAPHVLETTTHTHTRCPKRFIIQIYPSQTAQCVWCVAVSVLIWRHPRIHPTSTMTQLNHIQRRANEMRLAHRVLKRSKLMAAQ